MNDLVIHPKTERVINNILNAPSHGLLIVAKPGSGKLAIASYMAEKLLNLEAGQLDKYPYHLLIEPFENKSIGIDVVRQLDQFLALKVPRTASINRVVIIQDAENLTLEAQNALLKLLEEPPASTVMLLTASHAQSLLPTVRSRLQEIVISQPDEKLLTDYFVSQGFNKPQISRAYVITGGLPGLMTAILDDKTHPLLEATDWARRLLNQSVYDRLLAVDELSKNLGLAKNICLILKQMAHVSLLKSSGKTATKWQKIMQASYDTHDSLNKNTQSRLAITELMLNL